MLCACVEGRGRGGGRRGGEVELIVCVRALNNYLLCPEYVAVAVLPQFLLNIHVNIYFASVVLIIIHVFDAHRGSYIPPPPLRVPYKKGVCVCVNCKQL